METRVAVVAIIVKTRRRCRLSTSCCTSTPPISSADGGALPRPGREHHQRGGGRTGGRHLRPVRQDRPAGGDHGQDRLRAGGCAATRKVRKMNMKQIQVIEGKVVAPEGMKVGIVAARFNEIIVNKLLGGAVDGLVRHGVEEENITAAWVPGAFEIPITAQKMAQSGKYDAVICVGAVIRGDTSHYDLVCNESAKGIAQIELATGIPVLFGIITTENIEQAIARAGSKAGNKGYDCALSAIEMVNLIKQL